MSLDYKTKEGQTYAKMTAKARQRCARRFAQPLAGNSWNSMLEKIQSIGELTDKEIKQMCMKPQIRPDPTVKVSILHDFSAKGRIGNTETFQRFLRYSETGWKSFMLSLFRGLMRRLLPGRLREASKSMLVFGKNVSSAMSDNDDSLNDCNYLIGIHCNGQAQWQEQDVLEGM
ncbi:hypothetical protein GLAREA_08124 [Glarea lozoyensis ATCC 20868]|uniref:Uncharacterized protein n=1 Tax=Glarea lozoyensis (strain ATCC 20868 / MF5171) TaxID=1116229 RepID=S3DC99_GLAL2|nr:uncharacterized protein GLAREA_08124 [Glarea lozoyensis ATCC 20868]EPE24273.1 hypothetical protein GLAREA_08124 [Glarea lozoyensis ATCC 20868]